MTWGFSGNPATIEDILASVPKGWHGIVGRLVPDLLELGWDGVVYQVKEKFAGLRFYIGAATEAVHDRILQAEIESEKTCQICGEPGRIRGKFWLETLCDGCTEQTTIIDPKEVTERFS